MITIDTPISFLLGSGLAYAASKKEGQDMSAVFFKGFILQTCVLTPVILFFMLRFADWEWNYMFNAQDFFFGEQNRGIGATAIAVIAGLLNLTYILGFKFAENSIKNGKDKLVIQVLGAIGALVVIIMLVMIDQTLHIGTLAEFQNGEAGLIFLNPSFLIAQTSAGILLGAGIFLTLKSA